MKNKKGFISTSIIYSFFLVFILLMIAALMAYTNKRFLVDKIRGNINKSSDIPVDYLKCTEGDLLSDCMFKNEWQEMAKIWDKIYAWCDENNIPRKAPAGETSQCTKNKAYSAGVLSYDESYYYDKQVAIYASAKYAIDEEKLDEIKRHLPDLTNGTEKALGETKEVGIYRNNDLYFYRGAEDDNYVVFSNKLWSIVSFNEKTNTIKLIYQGEYTDSFKNKTTSNKYSYIKNNGFLDANKNGTVEEYDARHFNVNKLGEFKKEQYEWAYKAINSSTNSWCDTNKEYRTNLLKYINSSFCSKSKEKQIELLQEKLDYGNGVSKKYSGATSLWNIGYMNNGKKTLDKSEKLSNNVDSTIKSIIDGWVDAEFGAEDKKLMSNNVVFCAAKDIGLTVKSGLIADKIKYASGAYCTRNTDGAILYSTSPIYATDGAGWTFPETVDEPTLDINMYKKCQEIGYDDGFAFEYATMTAAKVTVEGATSYYCAEESKMPTGSYAGLLNSVEILEAGGVFRKPNNSFYLDSDKIYWTADFAFGENADIEWNEYDTYYFVYDGTKLTVLDDEEPDKVAYIKPVINLKGTVKYISGTGTIDEPYVIGV